MLMLFSFFALIPSGHSIPIDNDVEIEPQILCGPGYISVTFMLKNNFEGHVYVKNHYNDTQCRNDQTGKRTASISVPFSGCGVQRTRSLNPKGIFVNTVVVISFHPKFITKSDRAYSFQCFYVESEKTVAAQMDVSEMTSQFLTQRVPMPLCRYEVLDAHPPNGQPIKYATVGQQVFHRWVCETDAKDVFCMNVNSCYVYDGLGDQAQLLDSTGCAVDRYLLQNIEYTSDLSAVREAHVFKFADRATVSFQCQVAITVREPTSVCPRPACATVSAPGTGETTPSTASTAPAGGSATASVANAVVSTASTAASAAVVATATTAATTTSAAAAATTTTTNPVPTVGIITAAPGRTTSQEPSGSQELLTIPDFPMETSVPEDSASTSPMTPPPGPITAPSAGLITAPPTGPTTTLSNAFRSTSSSSYRLITVADDPVRDNGSDDGLRDASYFEDQARKRRSFEDQARGKRSFDDQARKERSLEDPHVSELGVWDVRAKSISVFDLDDVGGLKNNEDEEAVERHWNGDEWNHGDYCFSVHSLAALFSIAVLPTVMTGLACLVYRMKRY